MSNKHTLDNYNDRLFSGKGIRSKLHFSRYIWLKNKLKKYQCSTEKVLELGCFDGKSIEFFEKKPVVFHGYDANWEGGLDMGKAYWKNNPGYHLKLCTSINDFTPEVDYFDISVCQETAEHLPEDECEEYIKRMAMATKSYCFISVPNEKGLVFLLKYLFKLFTQPKNEQDNLSYKDIFNSFFGRLHLVKRDVRSHKGFDYKRFESIIKKYFNIIEVNCVPVGWLPIRLGFTICYVCKRKSE